MTPHTEALDALDNLLQAAEEIHRHGAQTGPQWTRLSAAIIKARANLADALANPTAWRDIASAPKDGTDVLLSGLRIGVGSFGICGAQEGGYRANEGEPCWRTESRIKRFPNPTHWQPLPPFPAHPAEQQEGNAAGEKDAAMLDWMAAEECCIQAHHEGNLYRIFWPNDSSWQSEWFPTPRAAIDAAMQAMKGEGNGAD